MFGTAKKPTKANVVVRKVSVAKPTAPTNGERRPLPATNGSSKLLGTGKARNNEAAKRAFSANTERFLKVQGRQDSKTASPSPSRSRSPSVRNGAGAKRKNVTPEFHLESDSSSDDEGEGSRKRVKPSPRNGTLEPDMKRTLLDEEAMKADVSVRLDGDEAGEVDEDRVDIIPGYDLTFGKFKEYSSYLSRTGEADGEAAVAELQYPSRCAKERFQLVLPSDDSDYNPLTDIIASVEHICTHYFPEDIAATLNDDISGHSYPLSRTYLPSDLVKQLDVQTFSCFCGAWWKGSPHDVVFFKEIRRALRKLDGPAFLAALDKFNAFITRSLDDGVVQEHLRSRHSVDLPLVERILSQIYARTVSPEVRTLKAYDNGTDDVYGELLPRLVHQIFEDTKLRSDQVFVDLGSGVGNVVLQAALEIGCESWGVEKMVNPSGLAVKQLAEFGPRCKRWAIKPGKASVIAGDFLQTPQIDEVLKRADVVLVNNQAFTPDLNGKLTMKFMDLKDGCKIVSLKSFLPDNWQIRERSLQDPRNLLMSNVKKEYFSGSVSWTDVGGNYYVATKDTKHLDSFVKKMQKRQAAASKADGTTGST